MKISRTTTIEYRTRWPLTIFNLWRRIRKIRRRHLCRLWKIHYGINVSRQTVHPSLVQRGYWARGIHLPTRLAVSHRVSWLCWARGGGGGVKGCCSDTGYNVVFRTRGRCTLDRKDGRQIVRGLSGGSLRHYCIQEPAPCDGGSVVVWVGIYKGRKTSLVAPDGNSTPSCSWTFWKTSAFHTKEELMETTFGCKTTTFAHIWLLQWNNFLKHMGWCWYHDPLAP